VARWNGEIGRRKTPARTIHARHTNRAETSAAVRRAATVIRTSSVAMLTVSATPHDARLMKVCTIPSSNAIAAPSAACAREAGHASGCKSRKSPWVPEIRHILQAKPTGGAALAMAGRKREVTVAIGIGTGWSDS
jgi:hypothetical protein